MPAAVPQNGVFQGAPSDLPEQGQGEDRGTGRVPKKRAEIEDSPSQIVVYQDEVHFQAQTTITSGWYKKGSAPKVKSLSGRDKVSYSGFVRPDTGQLFVVKPTWFDYKTTIDSIRLYIEAFPLRDGCRFAMIMDNATWHKKAIRMIEDESNTEYADIREKVDFVKLPPYSPDLNPIEQVWRITRRENTHNRFFKDKSVLEQAVDNAFDKWAKPNAQLKSLCSFKRN